MNGTLLVASIAIAALVAQEALHRKERKDLLNRIMARDYGEYWQGDKPPASGHVGNALYQSLRRKGDISVTPGGVDHGDKH